MPDMSESKRHDENLSSPQRRAIKALATGATKEQAAVVADRTVQTLRRWEREDAAYADALRAASNEALNDAARQLRSILQLAITAVRDVLEHPTTKDRDKLRAFDLVAGHAVKLTEYAELEERVAALEEQAKHEH
jgi:hypothetical protein